MEELTNQYKEGLITFTEFVSNMLLVEDEESGTVWNRNSRGKKGTSTFCASLKPLGNLE